MFQSKRERFKTYILLLLISASFIQVGILWSYQSQGFPFSFLMDIFSHEASAPADTQVRKEFFVPYRIVASDGQFHWMVDRDDERFEILWGEAKKYLAESLAKKPPSYEDAGKWGDIIQQKSFVFEFKSGIHSELIHWLLQVGGAVGNGPSSIYKVAVLFTENPNNNVANLYILDDKGNRLYQYMVRYEKDRINREMYLAMLTAMKKDYSSKAYSVIRDLDPGNKSKYYSRFNSDAPYITSNTEPVIREIPSVKVSVPGALKNGKRLAEEISGGEKNFSQSYDEKSRNLVLWNSDNIYTLYGNGLLEYKYTTGYNAGAGNEMGMAFLNACNFIFGIKDILLLGNDVEIFLSSAGKSADHKSYRFTFDYMVDGLPVYFADAAGGANTIRNAIQITAAGDRVLTCTWLLKDLEKSDYSYTYNLRTEKILTESGLQFDQFLVKEMGTGYVVKALEEEKLEPSWIITTDRDENLYITLTKAGGE